MTTSRLTLCFCAVFVLLGGLAPAATAANSPVEELTKVLPDDLIFFMATSGTDAVEDDFNKSIAGRIWNDPSTQTFCTSIKTKTLPTVMQKAQADGDVPQSIGMILQYAELVLSRPVVMGIARVETKEGPPACFFAIIDAGSRKADLAAVLNKLETMLGEDKIGEVEVGSMKMHGPKDKNDVPVYWGWAGNHLVFAGNDAQGAVVKYVAKPRVTAATYLDKVPGHGDALAVYYDFGKLIGMMNAFAAREGGEKEFAMIKAILGQVGLGNLGTMTARVGFSGPDLVSDSFVEVPQPRRGIFAASKPVELSLFGMVDSQAMSATAFNYDLAGLYDGVMEAVRRASPNEVYPEIQEGLTEIESEIKLNIRNDLLGTLAGPVVSYTLPAGKMTEAPMGGFVVMAKLSDGARFEKTMTTLGELVAPQFKGMLQIGSQTTEDGRTLHVWSSPVLAFAQLMPTWSIVDSQLVLGSNTALCQKAISQVASQGEPAESLLDAEGFKKVTAQLPKDKDLLSLSYIDSQMQFTQMMMQFRQLWPVAVMGAMQQGIELPVMLPALEHVAQEMQPACEYSYAGPDGLYSHYQGSGLEVSLRGVAGAAVGAGVAMPALARARQQAKRVASMAHLKQLSLAVIMYADDHDGTFPDTLEQTKPYYGDAKILQSPRKPKSFSGPSYIYVPGYSTNAESSHKWIILYENPQFCEDTIVAAFLDGHVEAMRPGAFRRALEASYEHLGREMPEIEFKD